MNLKQQILKQARTAKKAGWSREKAEHGAPPKTHALYKTFMDEFDRYQPRHVDKEFEADCRSLTQDADDAARNATP